MAPLFSQQLRSLRGTLPVSKMAGLCNISREAVRRIESGKLLPSNSVLRAWLAVVSEDLKDRPDIIASVISARSKRNTYVRETAELKSIVSSSASTHVEQLTDKLVRLLDDCGMLSEESEDWMRMRVKRLLEEHVTETI
jgi:transcriptional regulator with XRE-family HTH domain